VQHIIRFAPNIDFDLIIDEIINLPIASDYAENVRLDNYDPNDIDDEDIDRMDPAERAKVEALMNRRDNERARLMGRIPEAFLDGICQMLSLLQNELRFRYDLITFGDLTILAFFSTKIDDADLNVTHRKRRVHEQDLLENDFDDMVCTCV